MKKALAFALSFMLIIGLMPMSALAEEIRAAEPAADAAGISAAAESHWAQQSADKLTSEGIISEQDSELFKSLENLDGCATRAQAVSMLVRSMTDVKLAEVADKDTGKLTDISGHWAEQYILAAVEAGFVGGYPDGTFRPENTITRAEIAKITALSMGLKASENASNPFNDLSESDWEYEYVLACAEKGLIKGYSDGSFKPDGQITCGESVTISVRAHEATVHSALTDAESDVKNDVSKNTPIKNSSGVAVSGGSSGGGSSSSGGASYGSSGSNNSTGGNASISSTGSASGSSNSGTENNGSSNSEDIQNNPSGSASSSHTVRPMGAASSVWNGSIATSFAGGSGTSEDPYQIANGSQLAYLAALTNKTATYNGSSFDTTGKYFKLVADITLNDTSNWESWDTEDSAPANSWTAIGTYDNRFKGTFDGDGHVVRGIYINTEANYQGLFGYAYNATIKNVGVVESYIKGGRKVGGVVGENSNGTVTDCYNTGALTCTNKGGDVAVGGVVGYNNYEGTVTACYNTGTINGINGNQVGGVVGFNQFDSTVSNCYNTGTVSGSTYVGGVVGGNWEDYATVSNCYNTGTVSGRSKVGGVVGINIRTATVSNCYNTGTVTCSGDRVGGVVGWNTQGNATVSNCYNTGTVSGSSYVGGVVGQDGGTVSNCYCLDEAYSGNPIGVGTGTNVEKKTADEMKSDEFVSLLDRDNETPCWTRSNSLNDGFPILAWQVPCEHSYTETVTTQPTCTEAGVKTYTCSLCGDSYTETIAALGHDYQMQDGKMICSRCGIEYRWDGSGTELDPYLIGTPEQLAYLAALTNKTATYNGSTFDTSGKYFKLTADIVLNNTSNWENWDTESPANSWTPIGGYHIEVPYLIIDAETFSTAESTYGNLYCYEQGYYHHSEYREDYDIYYYLSSFKGTFDGDEHVVRGIYINTEADYQGLFGYTESATIKNIGVVESHIKGNRYVGGVVGANGGTVSNCYNTGTITGKVEVGGVVGYNYGTVSNCYNMGAVSGPDYVGGVVGYNYGYSYSRTATVSNCYNTGTVSGTATSTDAGGVVGYNSNGTVSNCYNTGAIICINNRAGGVLGINYSNATVSNCYCLDTAYSGYLVRNSVSSSTATDVEYKTAAEMKCTAFASLLDRDNSTPCWARSDSLNDGFPILVWQEEPCEHSYTETVTTQPTCTEAGVKTYTCSLCGDSYTETIAALGHDWSSEWTVDIKATCTQEGSKSHHCNRCDAKKDETVIEKTSHSYTETVTTEPTCTEAGVKTYTCSVCGDSYTETIAAPGHDWSSEWTVDVKATCTQEGSKSHHCNRCDATTDITVIEKTLHSYTSVTKKGITTHTCKICGDSYSETNSTYEWYYDLAHDDCYTIQSEDELKALEDLVDNGISFKDETIKLSEDITIDSDMVIGSEDNPFLGTFDGCGHTLTINNGSNSVIGVLGEAGEIRGLIIDGSISGDTIGGIVSVNYGLIINCRSTAEISAESFGGGICGINNGEIINCHVLGDIYGDEGSTYGGVCGENNGKIYACLVSGTIDSERYLESDEIDGRTVSSVNCENEHTDRVWGFVVGENNGDVSYVYYKDEFEVETARHAFGSDTSGIDLNADNVRYFTSKGIISGKGSSAVKVIRKLNELAEKTSGANQWQSYDIGNSYAPCTVDCASEI